MIKEILAENFKCFERLRLPLKFVNLLTGTNGMGKSTVLQSLLLLRQSYYKHNGIDGLYLNGKYVELGNAQDILYEKAQEERVGLGYVSEAENHFFEFQYIPDSDFMPILTEPGKIKSEFFQQRFTYLSAYRIEPRELYRITNEEELERREFGNNGEFALQYLNNHWDDELVNEKVIIADKLGETLSNQTRVWLDKISPGVSPKVLLNSQLRTSELRYEFIEGKEKTNSYKSVNVGFGITYVLPLIISILSAKKGDIIIAENPEAHIHPAGQRVLGELIARAGAGGVQIIVETHSDHIINGIRLAVKHEFISGEDVQIAFFYKEEENGYRHAYTHPNILKDGRLDCWPDGFFDEWDKALYELI